MSTPRYHDGLWLVSTGSTVNCVGLFVVSALTKWGATSVLRDAVLETEALVTAAVKATGIPAERLYRSELARAEFLAVQIYGLEASIRIEVWDSSPNPPHLPGDSSHVKRGCYPKPRGKVVWVELALYPQRRDYPPQAPPEQFAKDPDTIRRVREGLEEL